MLPEDIFNAAADTASEVEYSGALTPASAHTLQNAGAAVIVDVRTTPELAYVGRVPDSIEIEWLMFPDMQINPQFLAQLQQHIKPETPVLFICRSGARSHYAATAAAGIGYRAYNVLEGFEGDLDDKQQRNTVNGWRMRGLPWQQS
ncbi:MAG: rhodanese-like domain-containing protein [Proteobacteria bacterium]|nr:rhodanese-like domain-containing protein [Pseudomonadota bacterium]MCH9758252.1 rhodanese-like domain-containing protein [Pseudomonadota bacterium]